MSWDFISEKRVKKTNKNHICVCCSRTIPTGSKNINHFAGKCDGALQSSYECNWCEEHRQSFIDDEYYGEFWDCLREDVFLELFDKYEYKECDCGKGDVDAELEGNYLVFKCQYCDKVWHKEHMAISKEVKSC